MVNLGINKAERIYKRDEIKSLFDQGKAFNEFPFRVYHSTLAEGEEPIKFGISIPKKKFKRAVDRNFLKRKSREAYRKNRLDLKKQLANKQVKIAIMLVFTGNESTPFNEIQDKIILILQRLGSIYA